MAGMDEASVDCIVSDPPYGLEFMGKGWDSFGGDTRQVGDPTFHEPVASAFGKVRHSMSSGYGGDSHRAMVAFGEWCREWGEQAYRVLRDGGTICAFSGSRTYHRLTCGLEDAGFLITGCALWMYGSGFPKSLDVAKAIDKQAGIWRGRAGEQISDNTSMAAGNFERTAKGNAVTDDAKAWEGWGTALKPAWEPIVVGVKR